MQLIYSDKKKDIINKVLNYNSRLKLYAEEIMYQFNQQILCVAKFDFQYDDYGFLRLSNIDYDTGQLDSVGFVMGEHGIPKCFICVDSKNAHVFTSNKPVKERGNAYTLWSESTTNTLGSIIKNIKRRKVFEEGNQYPLKYMLTQVRNSVGTTKSIERDMETTSLTGSKLRQVLDYVNGVTNSLPIELNKELEDLSNTFKDFDIQKQNKQNEIDAKLSKPIYLLTHYKHFDYVVASKVKLNEDNFETLVHEGMYHLDDFSQIENIKGVLAMYLARREGYTDYNVRHLGEYFIDSHALPLYDETLSLYLNDYNHFNNVFAQTSITLFERD